MMQQDRDCHWNARASMAVWTMMISLWQAAGWNKGLPVWCVCFREPSWWGRWRLFQVLLWHVIGGTDSHTA